MQRIGYWFWCWHGVSDLSESSELLIKSCELKWVGFGRYRIEQELGTEIKPIPPTIEKDLYCA